MVEEKLEVFDLRGHILGVEKRKKFYEEIEEEYKKTKSITKQVKAIRLMLLNSNGMIFIQRRSRRKDSNAGLYDKTIGGHIVAGHTWYMTVVKECHEELGFPAVVLDDNEFSQAIGNTDVSIIGLFREIDHVNQFMSRRTRKDDEIVQPFISKIFVGYYDGPLRFKDGESVGIECFTREELLQEIKDHPKEFTDDLKFMIKKYGQYLVPIKELKVDAPVKAFE